MNKKKLIVGVFGVMVSAFAVMGISVNNHDSISLLVDENIEALTNSDEPSWAGKKIKKENCTCPNGEGSGFTLKCRTDGNLEDCSATQQGLTGCYKVSWTGSVTQLCTL